MDNLETIINFLNIDERIASGGQPTPEQIGALAEAGFKAVINLALPVSTRAIPDEGALVTGYGLSYVHIPVNWEQPTLDDFDQFLGCMTAFQNKKVFVHCAMNMRVSCFLFLYRVIAEGLPAERAASDVLKIWQPNETWQKFIAQVLATRDPSSKREKI